ncbi:hypothetical protein PUN28_016385 [Cardiocondyla obscurior]|uniref:Secreted protein n=1 Tax=Cardiocondyla obscurior TaxID=286306 RepID=A0AAW2ERS7_9HYME
MIAFCTIALIRITAGAARNYEANKAPGARLNVNRLSARDVIGGWVHGNSAHLLEQCIANEGTKLRHNFHIHAERVEAALF